MIQQNDEIDRLLTHEVMHELGILPLNIAACNVKKMLDTLDEVDATPARRKFRKLWRMLANAERCSADTRKARYGLGSANPTIMQRTARKQLVLVHVKKLVTARRKAISDSLNK
jgi:hypothetical protein